MKAYKNILFLNLNIITIKYYNSKIKLKKIYINTYNYLF